MPKDKFKLPSNQIIDRVFGVEHPNGGSRYLNGVRMGIVKEDSSLADAYHSQKKRYAEQLATEVVSVIAAPDAVVKPPSRRDDADVYLDAIVQLTGARTLGGFSRKGAFRAGDSSTTLEDMIYELDYLPDGKEHEIKSIVIVDETVADGKTAAAMLHHLRKHGLSEAAQVTLATWVKVKS
jgi:uracil phosphoribosyltransferase